MGHWSSRLAPRGALLMTLCLMGGATSCVSRLRGAKSVDYDLPHGSASGIPFRLARPVFVIQNVVDTETDIAKRKGDFYQLVVEYRSDPTAVYWVRADPAEFQKSELTMSFSRLADTAGDDASSHGFLTSLKEEGTDQSKGFIEAIGKFATEVIGLSVLSRGNAEANRDKELLGGFLIAGGSQLQALGTSSAADSRAVVVNMLADQFASGVADPERAAARGAAIKALNTAPGIAIAPSSEFAFLNDPAKFFIQATIDFEKLLKMRLKEFREMTGIDLGIISQLYVKFPLLKDLFVTAVKRPPALPGKLPDDLATLKDTILASYSNVKLSGTFEEDAFTRANIQAHWALWRQHYLLDHMYQKKAHSKEYDDSLEMLYSALDLPGEWHELQRLELFVESTTPLYEKGSPGAPDAGFMGELKAATARIEAIEGMLLDRVKPAVLDADPSEIKERKERMEGPGKSWCKWKETDVEVVRPRWVYQECVPGPAADRAVWLRDYLQRQNPGKPPAEDDEFVVLVERSYPDQEVQPGGRLIGQVKDVTKPACPKKEGQP